MTRKRMNGDERKRKVISLLVRDGNLCHWCKGPFEMKSPKRRPTLEHLKPFGQGGSNALENLALVHEECNR